MKKYIFTDEHSQNIVDFQFFEPTEHRTTGDQALEHIDELREVTGKKIIGWCKVGDKD